jgi:sugar phosphate isomerase/epimerase
MRINRRNFLQQTAMAGTAMIMPSMEDYATPFKTSVTHAGYELKIMATNWGYHGDVASFCAAAKKEGYDGIEVWVPGDEAGRNALAKAVEQSGLALGLLCGGSDKDPAKHFQQFRDGLNAAIGMGPIYINCHSGRDHFSMEQNKPLIDLTTERSKTSGMPIYHETHRGRTLFAATVTREYINRFPDLRLTLDISHWCCVHESGLEDQEETVALALSRAEHIHARIGHAEGPQVNDPRAPEWDYMVKRHFAWWDKIVERKKKEGKRLTILTEFGPPHYLPALPYSQLPIADQWAINVHMMKLLRTRYS